jgi:hypothetical protein
MIDAKNCAKDEVKDTNWQNCLPKTYKMEAKWYATEGAVAFDGTNNLSGKGTAIFSNVCSIFLKNICVYQKFCLPLRSKDCKLGGVLSINY